jgi:uncharacterized membrane protein
MKLQYPSLVAAIVAAVAAPCVMAQQDTSSEPKSRAEVQAEARAALEAEKFPVMSDIQNIALPLSNSTTSLQDMRNMERDAERNRETPSNDLQDISKPK